MAIESGFFRSLGGDRKYLAEFFVSYFASFIGNGVFPNPSTNLQVLADSNLNTVVSVGKGWINGHYLNNTTPLTITHAAANGTLPRIDRIVFATNATAREMQIYVKQGTLGTNPIAPPLVRNGGVYELALADVLITPGTTNISQSAITDQRLNTQLCGIVHGTVDQVDTTTLDAQYKDAFRIMTQQQQEEFNIFLDSLQDALSGDVAANLSARIFNAENEITSINTRLNTHISDDVKHNIFTLNGVRYQSQIVPTADLTGLRFIYNEVTN